MFLQSASFLFLILLLSLWVITSIVPPSLPHNILDTQTLEKTNWYDM